jgi:hypothetical protein
MSLRLAVGGFDGFPKGPAEGEHDGHAGLNLYSGLVSAFVVDPVPSADLP